MRWGWWEALEGGDMVSILFSIHVRLLRFDDRTLSTPAMTAMNSGRQKMRVRPTRVS